MRQIIILMTLLLVILGGCIYNNTSPGVQGNPVTGATIGLPTTTSYYFLNGFDEINKIDSAFKINFRKEKLDKLMVEKDVLPTVINHYEKFKEHVLETTWTNETEVLLNFTDVRIWMLKAQNELHEVKAIGPLGLTQRGKFNCKNKPLIALSSNHLGNMSEYSKHAIIGLDLVLERNPWTRKYLGVGETRIDFYDSPLHLLNEQLIHNRYALQTPC